jgi:hypothetical protein
MNMNVAKAVRMLAIILLTVFICALSAEAGYQDNGDGTVTDTWTGLMWQQGDDQNDDGGRVWEDALAYCEALDLAKHQDWRLPNYRELASLVDYSRYNPSIDPLFFECRSGGYWSGSTYINSPGYAWNVYFSYGYKDWPVKDHGIFYVRCVRGGPGPSGPFVTLTIPNGGESWKAGTKKIIQWTYEGEPGRSVKIELLKDGATVATIAEKTKTGKKGNGSHKWKIPARLASGSDYKIRVSSKTIPTCTDTSDGNFEILGRK